MAGSPPPNLQTDADGDIILSEEYRIIVDDEPIRFRDEPSPPIRESSNTTPQEMPMTVVEASSPEKNDGSFIGDGPTTTEQYSKASVFDKKDGNYTVQKFNDVDHNICIYLDNSGNFKGEEKHRYYINPTAILGLHISDSFNDWVASGEMSFLYLPEGTPNSVDVVDAIKSGQSRKTALTGLTKAALDNGKVLESYNFRGDGYDLLRIFITPKPGSGLFDNRKDDPANINFKKTADKWTLSYLFSVYEIEDVNDIPELSGQSATYMKCLKLHFHDVRWHILETTNQEYSTALPKDASFVVEKNSSGFPGQGVIYTGEALKDIFNSVLANPDNNGCREFNIPKDWPEWEKGHNQMFYTSPACYSAADDLEYIFGHHLSNETLNVKDGDPVKDISILHTNRAPAVGHLEQISLTPMSKLFKQAGKQSNEPGSLQKEHFFVTSFTSDKGKNVNEVYKAPMGGKLSDDVDLKTLKYGDIISYSFVDMSPEFNAKTFRTTPVHTIDTRTNNFTIDFTSHTVDYARRVISESYIQELYNQGKDNTKLFLPTIHTSKQSQNVFPTFSLIGAADSFSRMKAGLHNLLYTGLFQNACICFKVYGLTYRESGTFIGIDKTEGSADNDYNNKLYGQWLVIKVDHLFQAGAYMNIIYAVKIHRFKELKNKFENTIEPTNPSSIPDVAPGLTK